MLGFGYDDAQLAEKRHPARDELDAVSTEIPVYAVHQSGHLGVVNSKALELAGITADTPDPAWGVIRRCAGTELYASFGSMTAQEGGGDPGGGKPDADRGHERGA